jgi:hypothetical protein
MFNGCFLLQLKKGTTSILFGMFIVYKIKQVIMHSKTSKGQLMRLLFYRKTPTSNTLKTLIFAIGQSSSYSE